VVPSVHCDIKTLARTNVDVRAKEVLSAILIKLYINYFKEIRVRMISHLIHDVWGEAPANISMRGRCQMYSEFLEVERK
jgi:hypothetical protein